MAIDPGWNEPTLKLTQTKRQHFVPRTYLERFTRVDGKIRVTDLLENREYVTSLNNAAVKSRFYDVRVEGQNYSAEDWLAKVESDASPILTLLVDDPSSITTLTDEQEDSFARFIAALLFRTPSRQQEVGNMIDATFAEEVKMGMAFLVNKCGYGDDEVIAAYREFIASPIYQKQKSNEIASTMNYLLGEVQGFGHLFRAAPWRLGNVLGPPKLFTSDNPVVRHVPAYRRSHLPQVFFEYDYYLALSPDILLHVYPKPLSNGTEKPDLIWGGRQYMNYFTWEVETARYLICRNADRFIYDQGSTLFNTAPGFAESAMMLSHISFSSWG